MTTKEKIAVMQAYEDGKKIQLASKDSAIWKDYDTGEPVWNWMCYDYRVKPEDKPVRMTNRQLAEWCSMGKGLWKHKVSKSLTVYHYYWFLQSHMYMKVPDDIVIMPKDSDKWIEPTVDIYERDCKA